MSSPTLLKSNADPWIELIQSSSWNVGVEEIQPLVSLRPPEFLDLLKRLWAHLVLLGDSPSLREVASRAILSPYVKRDSLARVLAFLIAKELGMAPPPLVPMHPLMPFFESCQLALLWSIAKEEEEARALASRLLPMVSLATLWAKEEEFNERTAAFSVSLLSRAFCQIDGLALGAVEPYFLALAKSSPHWEEAPLAIPRISHPEWGLTFHRSDLFASAITLTGDRTSLGSLKADQVEIRAFGPQVYPLSDPKGFGILRQPDSQPVESWTSVAASPEVWFEVLPQLERDRCHLSLRFLGLKPEKPLAFCFYVKASSCSLGGELLKPRSLHRYSGEVKSALFGGTLQIESPLPGRMEAIPLAGTGGFWDADYLLAYEIHPVEARGEFIMSILQLS